MTLTHADSHRQVTHNIVRDAKFNFSKITSTTKDLRNGPVHTFEKTFEIRNNQCVHVQTTFRINNNGEEQEGTLVHLDLCKDISDFLDRNPEASSCFKKDLNTQMGAIFSKHLNISPKFSSAGQNFESLEEMTTETKIFDKKGFGDIEMHASQARSRKGISNVITGHKILQRCSDLNLGPFLNDPKTRAKPTTDSTTEEDKKEVLQQ